MAKPKVEKTKVTLYRGILISVTPEGRFVATAKGAGEDEQEREMSSEKLDGLKLAIDKLLSDREITKTVKPISLPVFGVFDDVRGWEEFEGVLTGVNRTNREFIIINPSPEEIGRRSGMKGRRSGMKLVADTPANREALRRFVEVDRECDRLRELVENREIRPPGYGRIEAHRYADVLDGLRDQHNRSAKAKPLGVPKKSGKKN